MYLFSQQCSGDQVVACNDKCAGESVLTGSAELRGDSVRAAGSTKAQLFLHVIFWFSLVLWLPGCDRFFLGVSVARRGAKRYKRLLLQRKSYQSVPLLLT